MHQLEILRIKPTDVALLQNIARQTFYETFSALNSAENMQLYLDKTFSTENLTLLLSSTEIQFYVAISQTQVVGYLQLNMGKAQTEHIDSNACEIERIYVLQQFHVKEVGIHLLEKAIAVAYFINAPFLWLGVWEENKRAIRFYTKHGFIPFDTHIFMLGNDAQTDILMKKML